MLGASRTTCNPEEGTGLAKPLDGVTPSGQSYDSRMLRRLAALVRDNVQIANDPVAYARRIGVRVGEGCRLLGVHRAQFGSEPYLIEIGNHVTIAAGTRFVTHDGGVWVLRHKYPDIDVVGRIRIEDNVFIGINVIILPGVTIGRNSVVAAGAVVRKDVEPGTVVGGTPARLLTTLEDYENRSLAKALHVRNLPHQEKRAAFLRHTGD